MAAASTKGLAGFAHAVQTGDAYDPANSLHRQALDLGLIATEAGPNGAIIIKLPACMAYWREFLLKRRGQ